MIEAARLNKRQLKWIRPDSIVRNSRNPRETEAFDPAALEPLRASIRSHGVLEPVIVLRHGAKYQLLEGERRWTAAKLEKLPTIPALVVDDLPPRDQVIVMFNIHGQRKGWAKAEEVRALRELLRQNKDRPVEELAAELGVSAATLSNRMAVLRMGDAVMDDIANDRLSYSSALRIQEVARTLARERKDLAEDLGGEKGIQRLLVRKTKARGKGMSQELVEARRDLADRAAVGDAAVRRYLVEADVTLADLRRRTPPLGARRKVDDLNRDIRRLEKSLRAFRQDLSSVPDLKELRVNLDRLMEAAQELESTVVQAMIKNRQ